MSLWAYPHSWFIDHTHLWQSWYTPDSHQPNPSINHCRSNTIIHGVWHTNQMGHRLLKPYLWWIQIPMGTMGICPPAPLSTIQFLSQNHPIGSSQFSITPWQSMMPTWKRLLGLSNLLISLIWVKLWVEHNSYCRDAVMNALHTFMGPIQMGRW